MEIVLKIDIKKYQNLEYDEISDIGGEDFADAITNIIDIIERFDELNLYNTYSWYELEESITGWSGTFLELLIFWDVENLIEIDYLKYNPQNR